MDTSVILEKLGSQPRAIASELDVKASDMVALERQGLVTRVGLRAGAGRGRPPVEWIVAGSFETAPDGTIIKAGLPPGSPRLEDIEEAKPYLTEEEERQVAFIERVFTSGAVIHMTFKGRTRALSYDVADLRILSTRYRDIASSALRRRNMQKGERRPDGICWMKEKHGKETFPCALGVINGYCSKHGNVKDYLDLDPKAWPKESLTS